MRRVKRSIRLLLDCASIVENRLSKFLQFKDEWIASLSSFALHLGLLLLLALWTFSTRGGGGDSLEILSGGGAAGPDIDGLEAMSGGGLAETGNLDAGAEIAAAELSQFENVTLAPTASPTLQPEVSVVQKSPEIANLSQAVSPTAGLVGGTGFVGSSMAARGTRGANGAGTGLGGGGTGGGAGSGKGRGQTPESEAAVALALKYIAEHQNNNGSWDMGLTACDGNCRDSLNKLDKHDIAATGLALLCFLGAGNTMHHGEYSQQVTQGIYYLTQNLKITSSGRGHWLEDTSSAHMYEHGMATLALCEALQMTGEESLKEPCQLAINFIVHSQHARGGWGYLPNSPGDLSIVSWQLMALKSAASAGLIVPNHVLRLADNFLVENCTNGFLYSYRVLGPTESMTSIGNLIRIFRGAPLSDGSIRRAQEYISQLGPSPYDVYYNYYATQFLFHLGGPKWNDWNEVMREALIQSQVKSGHMAGSWYMDYKPNRIPENLNKSGGRLYVTAMCCLTLEVYYRFLPVYEESVDEFRL